MCCNVLWCDAVRACQPWQLLSHIPSVWRCAAMCCSVLQCIAVCCSVLQCVAIWACQTWQPLSHIPSVSQCVAMCCSVLRCVAMCGSMATSNASATPSYNTQHYQPPSPPHPPFTCTQSFTNHTPSKEYAGLITHSIKKVHGFFKGFLVTHSDKKIRGTNHTLNQKNTRENQSNRTLLIRANTHTNSHTHTHTRTHTHTHTHTHTPWNRTLFIRPFWIRFARGFLVTMVC